MILTKVMQDVRLTPCLEPLWQTERHATTRFTEHILRDGPVKEHLKACRTELSEENIEILKEMRSKSKLLTYEALFIKEINPKINARAKFRSKKLTAIKWVLDSLYTVEPLYSVALYSVVFATGSISL